MRSSRSRSSCVVKIERLGRVGLVSGITALAACAPPSMFDVANQPTSEVTTLAPAAARDKIVEKLRQLGFETTVLGEDGLTVRGTASPAPTTMGTCPKIFVRDPNSDAGRTEFVGPQSSTGLIVVGITQIADRTSVVIDAQLSATYPHPFSGTTLERECPRAVELESQILAGLD